MQIFIFLAQGFEEIEAVSTIDILRRSKLQVITVSMINQKMVMGAHNISIVADKLFEETDFSDGEMFILPGGMPGSNHLNNHEGLKKLLKEVYIKNKKIAAICAAPIVLGRLHLLQGKKATVYPGFEDQLIGANYVLDGVVKDGNIITAKGPSFAIDFALSIVVELKGKEEAKKITETICYGDEKFGER